MHVGLVLILASAAKVAAQKLTEAQLDTQAKDMVDKMTVDQILGQMNQIDLSSADSPTKVDEFAQLNVGSYFNFITMGRKGNRVTANTDEWRAKLTEIQAIHMKRNNIPMIFGIDSVHGATYVDGSVLFPQSINTAATFNPVLAQDLGKYIGEGHQGGGQSVDVWAHSGRNTSQALASRV
ncbi:hypothetical protein H257_15980 [Aphanomyces astaci]|uniref:beta-glucosidase n=1 Tax=Aphanomyces astaci TaxID=112090 RepID=W4FMY4_APHAT|nr:hypothetical protein H257_15980 [Aphanomyces astaci]ETV68038.1 hypothetical protein H257_15980 [Aphanomyces astaci]|eukprot:XP_009842601.1 hypothetical protein H257_15980 [Aphanomyces astaci]